MQLWTLIVDSVRESLDRKIFWVMVIITLMVVLAMLSMGFEANRISYLFGAFEYETDFYNPFSDMGRSRIIGLVVYMVTSIFLGWIGITLVIIATAGMFPSMMQRGQIDVPLSKPISRSRLFLYKYLCGMVFAFLQATIFVVLSFLVMGFRWHVWVPAYLLCIPLMVLLFSYLYCVSVLVSVKTGSTVAAILLTMGAWFVFACPQVARDTFEQYPELQEHQEAYRTIKVASWIPPKTGHIQYLAARWTGAGASIDIFPASMLGGASQSEKDQIANARKYEKQLLEISPLQSIGSSLAFEAVIVMLAMWIFCRRDF